MLTGRTAFEGKTRASLLGAILKDEPPPRLARSQPLVARGARPHRRHLPREGSRRSLAERARSAARSQMGRVRRGHGRAGARRLGRRRCRARLAWFAAAARAARSSRMSVVARSGDMRVGVGAGRPSSSRSRRRKTQHSPRRRVANRAGHRSRSRLTGDGGIRRERPERLSQLWLRPLGSLDARASAGHRRRHVSVLVAGQPVHRLLRRRQAEEGERRRRTAYRVVRCACRPRRNLEPRQRDRVLAVDHQRAAARVSSRRIHSRPLPRCVLTEKQAIASPHFCPTADISSFREDGPCCPAAKPGRIRVGTLDAMVRRAYWRRIGGGDLPGTYCSPGKGRSWPVRSKSVASPHGRSVSGRGIRVEAKAAVYASFSASATGVLVYARGVSRPTMRITWIDRAGRKLGTVGEARHVHQHRVVVGRTANSGEVSRALATAVTSGFWMSSAGRPRASHSTPERCNAAALVARRYPNGVFGDRNAKRPTRYIRLKRVEGTTNDQGRVVARARRR